MTIAALAPTTRRVLTPETIARFQERLATGSIVLTEEERISFVWNDVKQFFPNRELVAPLLTEVGAEAASLSADTIEHLRLIAEQEEVSAPVLMIWLNKTKAHLSHASPTQVLSLVTAAVLFYDKLGFRSDEFIHSYVPLFDYDDDATTITLKAYLLTLTTKYFSKSKINVFITQIEAIRERDLSAWARARLSLELGHLYRHVKSYDKAEEAYRRALAINCLVYDKLVHVSDEVFYLPSETSALSSFYKADCLRGLACLTLESRTRRAVLETTITQLRPLMTVPLKEEFKPLFDQYDHLVAIENKTPPLPTRQKALRTLYHKAYELIKGERALEAHNLFKKIFSGHLYGLFWRIEDDLPPEECFAFYHAKAQATLLLPKNYFVIPSEKAEAAEKSEDISFLGTWQMFLICPDRSDIERGQKALEASKEIPPEKIFSFRLLKLQWAVNNWYVNVKAFSPSLWAETDDLMTHPLSLSSRLSLLEMRLLLLIRSDHSDRTRDFAVIKAIKPYLTKAFQPSFLLPLSFLDTCILRIESRHLGAPETQSRDDYLRLLAPYIPSATSPLSAYEFETARNALRTRIHLNEIYNNWTAVQEDCHLLLSYKLSIIQAADPTLYPHLANNNIFLSTIAGPGNDILVRTYGILIKAERQLLNPSDHTTFRSLCHTILRHIDLFNDLRESTSIHPDMRDQIRMIEEEIRSFIDL